MLDDVAQCWMNILNNDKLHPTSAINHNPTQCSNEATMLHPTMLDYVGPTSRPRLDGPL
jgi:hypothetical protein